MYKNMIIALERAIAVMTKEQLDEQRLKLYLEIADIDIYEAAHRGQDQVYVYCPWNLRKQFMEAIEKDGFHIERVGVAKFEVDLVHINIDDTVDKLIKDIDAKKAKEALDDLLKQ